MSYWAYGLVNNDNGIIWIYEIHFNKNSQPWGYSTIWPNRHQFFRELFWFIQSIPSMFKDVYMQLKYARVFTHKEILKNKPDWYKSLQK